MSKIDLPAPGVSSSRSRAIFVSCFWKGVEGTLKVTVKFFAYFRELFKGREEQIELQSGSCAGDLLNLLCNSPGRREQIFDGGMLKPHILVFKNGRDIRHLSGLETKLDEGDAIVIFPPVGGG